MTSVLTGRERFGDIRTHKNEGQVMAEAEIEVWQL